MDPLEQQLKLERRAFGIDPPSLEGDDRARFLRDMVLALVDEALEYMHCYVWKPWKSEVTRGTATRDIVSRADELADIFHFFLNLLALEGFKSFDDFLFAYEQKVEENYQRQGVIP